MWYLYTVFIRLTTLGAHLRLGTCLFCNKTINSNNKMRRRNKARFLLYSEKTPSPGKSLIRPLSILGGWEGGWVLIRGWALITCTFFCL